MFRTVIALCVVLGVSLFLASEMDWVSKPYAVAMAIVDTLAAVAVLIRPAGKAQAMIGLTFLLQVMAYIARIVTANPDFDIYWWELSLLAFLQLTILGGWWLHELADRSRAVPWFSRVAHSAHRKGMD